MLTELYTLKEAPVLQKCYTLNMTKILIGIVIIGAIIVGAYMFYTSLNPSQENQSLNPNSSIQVNPQNSVSKASLKDLAQSATPQKCTLSGASGDFIDGVVYVANGKNRADFTTMDDGKQTKSHMIGDGSNYYIWLDGMEAGFKTSVGAQSSPQQSGGIDSNQQYSWSCVSWPVDSSVFNPPSNIEFTDYSSIFNQPR